MITHPCRACSQAVSYTTLEEALLGAASPEMSEAQAELVHLLCEKGPLTVDGIRSSDRKHIGKRKGEVSVVYVRRLLTDVNKRLQAVPGIVAHVMSDDDKSTSNPTVMLFIDPYYEEWAKLEGAAPHVELRDKHYSMAEEPDPAELAEVEAEEAEVEAPAAPDVVLNDDGWPDPTF